MGGFERLRDLAGMSKRHVDDPSKNTYADDILAIDVSVYGGANDMPASNWPSEEQVSSEEVLRGIELLRELDEQRYRDLGL